MNDLRTLPCALSTSSAEETESVGAALARMLESDVTLPSFVALYGDLGVGKTAFVRGFASVAAPGRTVHSPTFTLVNEYRTAGRRPIFHFDLYRLDTEDDLYSIGYDDYLDAGLCLCEWCEKIPAALPARRIVVRLSKAARGTDCRDIDIFIEEAESC